MIRVGVLMALKQVQAHLRAVEDLEDVGERARAMIEASESEAMVCRRRSATGDRRAHIRDLF